jgi:hypothetical protein
VKNQVVSMMLDDGFALTQDTQYTLVFAKRVTFVSKYPSGNKYQVPGVLQVHLTVVPQSEKTRLSAFCVVNAYDGGSASLDQWNTSVGQRKYDAWLNGFFPKLVAKIEGGTPTPSPSGTAP